MDFNLLFLIVGTLLIVMALTESMLKRLPLTTSLLYLGAGVVLGYLRKGYSGGNHEQQTEFHEE